MEGLSKVKLSLEKRDSDYRKGGKMEDRVKGC
jgi:hypothetical protein